MENILTPEEKKYLNFVCRYIGSYGMESGTVSVDYYEAQDSDLEDITFETFENNFIVDVPDELNVIFRKIIENLGSKGLLPEPEEDAENNQLEISINCKQKEVSCNHYYTRMVTDDGSSNIWEEKQSDEISEVFDELDSYDTEDTTLVLHYNGGGDAGYIESSFENGEDVSRLIEDWCSTELESLHGGWEINEGSEGYFTFNLEDRTIELYHTYFTYESHSNTIWEENF